MNGWDKLPEYIIEPKRCTKVVDVGERRVVVIDGGRSEAN
jgi:hypothetical protein